MRGVRGRGSGMKGMGRDKGSVGIGVDFSRDGLLGSRFSVCG